jgi:hypothetical protein
MNEGLRAFLGVPKRVQVFLDNGAFAFSTREEEPPLGDFEAFVQAAQPDWHPIPRDFIPSPQMSLRHQHECLRRTMEMNLAYGANGHTPVIHISHLLPEYISQVQAHEPLRMRSALALGGIVPNLLRANKARPYGEILDGLHAARSAFDDKQMHVFGIGGTATVHLAALLKMDSADSSGWRNRAARGLVQLPGCGDRMVASLGKWRGRIPSESEWEKLRACRCPACRAGGINGLTSSGQEGFCHRATHNLWVLLEEARWVERRLNAGNYRQKYQQHLNNSTYLPLIEAVLRREDECAL